MREIAEIWISAIVLLALTILFINTTIDRKINEDYKNLETHLDEKFKTFNPQDTWSPQMPVNPELYSQQKI